jgi:molybdopterin-guanine dinucleotide biosynthesis protein A
MSTPSPASGFILAGGHSLRLGRDKALLEWRGSTLLDHQISVLSSVCSTVRVVGRETLPDDPPGMGPIGGISTALSVSNTDLNLIIAVDLPLLTSSFLKYFKQRCDRSEHALTLCRIDSRFPLCLGMRRNLLETLARYIETGNRSVHGFLETEPSERITTSDLLKAGFTLQLFANINTEADYRAALLADNS